MINVKALGQQVFPVSDAPLLDDQINVVGIAPFCKNEIFIQDDIRLI